jgi:type IV pilus assembly protein PilC
MALSKHPRAFSQMYHRAIAAGEQGGNLEMVLRQMADHIEKGVVTEKKIKGALTYPFIVVLRRHRRGIDTGHLRSAHLHQHVRGSSTSSCLAHQNPHRPSADWASQYGVYAMLGFIVAVAVAVYALYQDPGRQSTGGIGTVLRLPVIGRIVHLSELARCCRTMSLLMRIGLPCRK